MSNNLAKTGMWEEVKSLTKHGAIYGAGGALGKVVGFFMIPFYTRFLSPADYGTLELLDLSVMLFGLVVTMWMNASVIRYYHAYKDQNEKHEVISTVLLTASLLGVITAAGGIIFGKQLSQLILKSPSFYKYFWLLSVTFFFSSINNVSFSYLRARQRSSWVATLELFSVTLTLALNILFIAYLKLGVIGILYSSLISISISAITLAVVTAHEVNLHFSPSKLRALAVFGWPLVLTSISAFALNFSDRFFLQRFTTVSTVGIYALGYKFAFMLSFLIVQPFDSIWSARMYQIAEKENSGTLFSKIFRYYCLLLIAVALCVSLVIKEVICVVSAPAFHEAYRVVPVVLLAYIFQGMYRYVGGGIYIAQKTVYVGIISAVTLSANLLLNYILIPPYKEMGAALATAISFFLMAGLAYAAAQKVRPVPYHLSNLFIPLAIAALVYWASTRVSTSSLGLSAVLKASLFVFFPIILYLIGYVEKDEAYTLKQLVHSFLRRFDWRASAAPEQPIQAGAEPASVSVIIPAYNSARYVAETVESVLKQSYRPHEIIVVDDGSTDETRSMLEKYRDQIIYIHQRNAGEPAARNTGIRQASGNFIAFLDADDVWLPDKLKIQMDYFAKHPEVALVYSDMKIFDETGIVHESVKEWLNMSPPSGYIFREMFAETLFGSGTVIFRKACVEQVGFFDETFLVGSDYEMWLRMARCFNFGYVDTPLLMYRHHTTMATRGLGRSLQNGVPWEGKVIEKILKLYPEVEKELGRSVIRRRFARPYFYLGVSSLNHGKHAEARWLFGQSLRQWPWSLRCQLRYSASFLNPTQLARMKGLYHRFSRRSASTHTETRSHVQVAPVDG